MVPKMRNNVRTMYVLSRAFGTCAVPSVHERRTICFEPTIIDVGAYFVSHCMLSHKSRGDCVERGTLYFFCPLQGEDGQMASVTGGLRYECMH